MTERIRIRVARGNLEIEVEGPRQDVDELLERYLPSKTLVEENGDGKTSHKRPKRQPPARRTEGSQGQSSTFDPMPLVNAIKEHEQYELIESRVLHGTSRHRKVVLVLWVSQEQLRSGDVAKVLQQLGDKLAVAGVSNTIASNRTSFTQSGVRKSGAPPPLYGLTGRARKEFGEYLIATDEAA